MLIDESATGPVAPLWAVMVQQGTWLPRRLKHSLLLAVAGVMWVLNEALGLVVDEWRATWLDRVGRYWSHEYRELSNAFHDLASWGPVAIGVAIYCYAIAWCYCDSLCRAIGDCHLRGQVSPVSIRLNTAYFFAVSLLWSAVITLVAYMGARLIAERLGYLDQ